jgi:hypothetical protein
MFLQTLTLHDLLIGIPHDGPAIFIYTLVLVSVAAVIKGSMKKSEPVGADWRSDET